MKRRARNDDAFTKALNEHLARHSLTKTDLAEATGKHKTYFTKLTSTISPSSKWCELIADVTQASEEERKALHRAAATTNGYKI